MQRSKTLDTILRLNILNASATLSRTLSHQEAPDRTNTHVRTPHVAQGQLTPRANTNRLPGVVPTVETWSPWQTTVYADREVALPPRRWKLIDVRAANLCSRRGCQISSDHLRGRATSVSDAWRICKANIIDVEDQVQ